MYGWEIRMQVGHYLERGVSKAELSRRFGVSRRTIHAWIESGQLDRDLSSGAARYSPRPRVAHKLDPYKELIEVRLGEVPSCRRSACSTRCVGPATTAATAESGTTCGRCGRGLLRRHRCGSRRQRAIRARWTSVRSGCPGDVGMRCWWCSATPGSCGCVSTRGRRCRSSSRGLRARSVGSAACRRSSSSIRCARWSCRTTALRAASWP